MKYYTRSKEYRASNVTLSVDPLEARSYAWWIFLKRINGKLVFNNYSYSPSTSGHQRKVRAQLERMGIRPDCTIECPKGLQDLASGIAYYTDQIERVYCEFANPRRRRSKDIERLETIDWYRLKIGEIQSLLARLPE